MNDKLPTHYETHPIGTADRIKALEAALYQIFNMSGVDGKQLSDAIRLAGNALGPDKV